MLPPPLPTTLDASIAAGLVKQHGRLQPLDERQAVLCDASIERVQPSWRPALDAALAEWLALPKEVTGLSLVAVYARGSIVRGLALEGISDVDTLGFATVSHSDADSELKAWQSRGSERARRMRSAYPFCSGLEMRLVCVPERSSLGGWLRGDAAAPASLADTQLRALDAFRLASQAVCLHGSDLVPRLPPPVPRPRLVLEQSADLARASRAVAALAVQGSSDKALAVARWAAKRALRAGMELAAADYGAFSRDLLPCHRAISAVLGQPAGSRSLLVLQLACMPEEEVARHGGGEAVAARLIHAAGRLAQACDTYHLARHFSQPLLAFEQLPETPPLPPALLSAAASFAVAPAATSSATAPSGFESVQAALSEERGRWARRAVVARARAAASSPRYSLRRLRRREAEAGREEAEAGREEAEAGREEAEAGRLKSDDLGRLTIDTANSPRHTRVLDLAWDRASGGSPPFFRGTPSRARVEGIARRALAAGRRPVVLRGMASEIAPVGRALWNLDTLPTLLPRGRVRVSPSPTFTFVRERHPLCRSGAYPLPSRVCEAMSGSEFVARIGLAAGGLPPLFYAAGERYYMQADLPAETIQAGRVPALWRSLLDSPAQPLRLWVSTRGATTPLHFDSADSFLAQMRGSKRVTFFPPAALRGLYPYPADHPLHRRARPSLYAAPDERAEDYPRFSEAAAVAQTIELHEGDVVIFPRNWWHNVETTSALSVSVGCRFV